MWYKLRHRGQNFWIKDHGVSEKDKKREVFDASGKKLCAFGLKGARIVPGGPKGHGYCARSAGIPDASPNWQRNPNYWSRLAWSCKGERSVSKELFCGQLRKGTPPFARRRRRRRAA